MFRLKVERRVTENSRVGLVNFQVSQIKVLFILPLSEVIPDAPSLRV